MSFEFIELAITVCFSPLCMCCLARNSGVVGLLHAHFYNFSFFACQLLLTYSLSLFMSCLVREIRYANHFTDPTSNSMTLVDHLIHYSRSMHGF